MNVFLKHVITCGIASSVHFSDMILPMDEIFFSILPFGNALSVEAHASGE